MFGRFLRSFACSLTVASTVVISTSSAAEVTFWKDVAPIVYDNCMQCHRAGQSGPFSLTNFKEVEQHAETILAVVEKKYMPPWKPVDGELAYTNDRRLTPEEIGTIQKWVAGGCQEGNPKDAPSPPQFTEGWSLGQPDLIVKMPEAFPVPADGKDLYRTFALPVGLSEDRWIKAIELKPSAKNAVHHALFFVDATGKVKEQKSKDGLPGVVGMNFVRGLGGDILERGPTQFARGLGGYVPGATPNKLPGDLARFLPKGSDILMQTHFHPTGKKELEQAELGIYFSDTAPSNLLVPIQVPPLFGIGAGIDIPAGEKTFTLRDSYTLPIDVRAIEIGGHAHYICRTMKMEAIFPDGKKLVLLEIADWDLDWQDQYQFRDNLVLPKGTELKVEIVYDNSADNPENPYSPPKRITWGRESNDEMGSVNLLVVAVNENERSVLEKDLNRNVRESLRRRVEGQSTAISTFGRGSLRNDGPLKLFDRNKDKRLDENEIPERFRERLLDFMDSNGDGVLDETELEKGRRSVERLMNRDDDE